MATAFTPSTPLHLSPSGASTTARVSRRVVLARVARPPAARMGEGLRKLADKVSERARDDTALMKQVVCEHLPTTTRTRDTFAAMCAAMLVASSVGILSAPVCGVVHAEVPESAPETALVDDVAAVPKSTEEIFSKAMTGIEKRTGIKVHFVLVRSLPFGDSPGEYAKELASQWGLGDKDVVFAASMKLARGGVFVGEGAKSVLTEQVAVSIAEETFGVPAGEERYGTAILDVTNRLIPVLDGETDPGPPKVSVSEVVQNYKTKQETKSERGKYVKVVGGILVIAIVAPLIQTYWYVRND